MPTTTPQAIALRLAVLQARRLACLEKLACERIWRNEHLAGHESGMLAALDRCILDLTMERQAAGWASDRIGAGRCSQAEVGRD